MSLENVTEANFDATIDSENLTLVDFWASWCGPCRMLGPTLEKVQGEMGDAVNIVKCNIDENPGIASKFKVMNIPLMILFKDGEAVGQIVGNQPKNKIVKLIQEHQ